MLNMNLMEKHITERNKISDNVLFLVDNKNCLYQHGKVYPFTAIKEKCISETMYRDIENHSKRLTYIHHYRQK